MPAIAAGAKAQDAAFYWHLGDFRAIYDFDQDWQPAPGRQRTISEYEDTAWDDFLQHQIAPFSTLPVYLGIGNHELYGGKTRGDYLAQFADWLDSSVLKEQRLSDDPNNHRLQTYYHWRQGTVDFINLDNAAAEQFDSAQMKWFEGVLQRDRADDSVEAVVVGMHAALPDSISFGHSMSDYPAGERSGRIAYQDLLNFRNVTKKPVYVLASHSHFFMDGIFNTAYCRSHGGVLPGWIVGTAGAVRYALPSNASDARAAKTNVYGYLIASVQPKGAPGERIKFEFHQLAETDIPAGVTTRLGSALVHECFVGNSQAK
jgi:hypothetical protein